MFFTTASRNAKLGPMGASYSPEDTCPLSCPLKNSGCYSEAGPSYLQWKKTRNTETSISWDEFLIKVRKIEAGRCFRHNVAGDLASDGTNIDLEKLDELVKANRGRRGFTYTHHPLANPGEQEAVAAANARGFTINLSADSLQEADRKAELGVAPVVTLLPSDGPVKDLRTPGGRKVIVCPNVTHGKTCLECKLCAIPDRVAAIGFPSHGTRKRLVDAIIAAA
jgi:hypothetical protein